MYLAYLRAAFNTCYYCACICDHVEELQRKCIKHVRKPLTNQTNKDPPAVEPKPEDGKEKDNKDIAATKDKPGDGKDWKRNGE